jgi:hypothetical protein
MPPSSAKLVTASEGLVPLSLALSRGQSKFPWNVLLILDRCSGLYMAMLAMDGTNSLGKARRNMKTIVTENHLLAATIRLDVNNDISLDQASKETWRQIRGASDMYVSRMEKNKMRSGTLFENDQVIDLDLTTCKKYLTKIHKR